MTSPSVGSAGDAAGAVGRARIGNMLRSGLGAFATLAVVGFLATTSGQPWVLGSFGATCVLLFGFPGSPFSQPRNIIGGHVLASLVGLLFLHLFGPGWLPMAGAGACAFMLMMLTRTVHPPAGSNPIIVFLAQSGWSFLLIPTLAGACAIVVIGWLYWRALYRRSWPLSWH